MYVKRGTACDFQPSPEAERPAKAARRSSIERRRAGARRHSSSALRLARHQFLDP